MNTQYHFNERGMSGRAVRVRELSPEEVADLEVAAAKVLNSPETTLYEFQKAVRRNGLKQMLVEISDVCRDPMAEGVKWKKVSSQDLDDLGAFFKVKDVKALEKIYADAHEIDMKEIDAITGKAIPCVSEG